jgi:hypothetical protein
MDIVKNGDKHLVMQKEVAIESRARIYPATPDGSQWELRIHFETDLGAGAGKEILGELVLRSYNGGFSVIPGMMENASKIVGPLIAQLVKGMAQSQAEAARRIVPATAMPPELKQ